MNKKKIFRYVVGILPLILVVLFYSRLPEKVPMHWDINGTVRYDDKINIFILPLCSLAVMIGMPLSANIDPRKRNYQKFEGSFASMINMILTFLCLACVVVLMETMKPNTISIWRVISGGIGVLFAFLGNEIPKVRSNFFFGVKTPWALSSDEVWNRTQRLGGKLLYFSGIALVAGAFFLPEKAQFWLMMGYTMVICFLPMVMSYVWHKRSINEQMDE